MGNVQKVTGVLFMIPIASSIVFAGIIALPQTGQVRCHNTAGTEISCAGTGKDGEIRAGVPWPNPRFTVSGNCVTDTLTGLMWPKNGRSGGT